MSDAKTNFSKYIQQVTLGDQIIVCKNGKPVAVIRAYRDGGSSRESYKPSSSEKKVIQDLY